MKFNRKIIYLKNYFVKFLKKKNVTNSNSVFSLEDIVKNSWKFLLRYRKGDIFIKTDKQQMTQLHKYDFVHLNIFMHNFYIYK